jgi:xylan 1,4-beta-xylosidase
MSDAVSTDARADWESRIGLRSGHAFGGSAPELTPPGGLVAVAGGAQVTLTWSPVRAAIG